MGFRGLGFEGLKGSNILRPSYVAPFSNYIGASG